MVFPACHRISAGNSKIFIIFFLYLLLLIFLVKKTTLCVTKECFQHTVSRTISAAVLRSDLPLEE